MMHTTILDEFHGRGVAVVLEKRNVDDYGAFVVKVHRHYYDEESARAAFEAEKRRRSIMVPAIQTTAMQKNVNMV